MRTREDIESYLLRSHLSFQEVGDAPSSEDEAIWLVRDPSSGENIVVTLAGPYVLFRVKVLDLDEVTDRAALFERLLELNASDMIHGSYGIADGALVLTAALPLENLDYNEFQGTIDDLTMALTNHYETLAKYRTGAA